MTELLDDAMLLTALGEVLAPEPATPGADAMAALHRALDERAATAVATATGRDGTATVLPLAPPHDGDSVVGRSTASGTRWPPPWRSPYWPPVGWPPPPLRPITSPARPGPSPSISACR